MYMIGICNICGREFEGLSRIHCSWKCAEADNIAIKLQVAWSNDKGHTKRLGLN